MPLAPEPTASSTGSLKTSKLLQQHLQSGSGHDISHACSRHAKQGVKEEEKSIILGFINLIEKSKRLSSPYPSEADEKQNPTPPKPKKTKNKNKNSHTHIPSVVCIALRSAVLEISRGRPRRAKPAAWTPRAIHRLISRLRASEEVRGISEMVKALSSLYLGPGACMAGSTGLFPSHL